MMKVLLIKPCWPYPYSQNEGTYNRIWMPLGLANCAAILEQNGFTVEILDCHAMRLKPYEIKKYIRNFERIIITSSSRDRWQCPNIDITPFISAVREIKKLTDEVYVMGFHGTVEPVKILNLTGARAVIRGEPEETVLDLCRSDDLFKVKSISFKNNEKVIHTSDRELIDLKRLPLPAFHLLDFKKYSYEILGGNFSLFEMNRGCKFRCAFCNQIMYGDGVRSKSVYQIFEELRVAIENYNVRTGCFIDLEFFTNRKIASEVCEYLIKKKYKFIWACSVRADSLDRSVLLMMKKAGCRLIKIGVESGQQALLDSVNKSLDINKVEEVFKLCRSLRIKTLGFFLFGLPGETQKDREINVKYSKKLNPDFVSFHAMVPYKGTAVAKNGPMKLDSDLNKIVRRAYLEYYLRPSYLLKLSPSFFLSGLRLFWGRLCTLKKQGMI